MKALATFRRDHAFGRDWIRGIAMRGAETLAEARWAPASFGDEQLFRFLELVGSYKNQESGEQ